MTGNCSYFAALMCGDVATVDRLLQSRGVSADVVYDEEEGPSPLVLSLIRQDAAMVKMLLTHGADVCKPCLQTAPHGWGLYGKTEHKVYPLQTAVETNHRELVELLISWGASPGQCDRGLQGLLVFAANTGSQGLLQYVWRAVNEVDNLERVDWQEALHIVIAHSNLELLRPLVSLGACPNRDYQGLMPLTLAADRQDGPLCQELLACGADLNGQQQSASSSLGPRSTPLSCAVLAGMHNAVRFLISLGADVNRVLDWSVPDMDAGSSLLHIAVRKHNKTITEMLIGAGCNLNCRDNEGNSPLHIACKDRRDTEMLQLLLQYSKPGCEESCGAQSLASTLPGSSQHVEHFQEHQTVAAMESLNLHGFGKSNVKHKPVLLDVNVKNKRHGHTPLILSVVKKNLPAVSVLVAHSACDVNVKDKARWTALHHAAEWGNDVVVLELLATGAGVNPTSRATPSPLQVAVEKSCVSVVEVLLDSGACPSVLSVNNESLLHTACSSRNLEPHILQMLLEQGLDVNLRTVRGETALMLAAGVTHETDVIKLLLQHGALLNCQDYHEQETALSRSVYFGQEETACMLLKEGADSKLLDVRGNTVRDWAVRNARMEVLVLLLVAGPACSLASFLPRFAPHLPVMKNQAFLIWLTQFLSNPRSLRDSARRAVRQHLLAVSQGLGISRLVCKLPIPMAVQEYLMYEGMLTEQLPELPHT